MDELTNHAKHIRQNIVRQVYFAKSGHPGGSLSSADLLTALYFKVMDKDEKMHVDLISRPVKLSVGKDLITYLKERPELEFRIN